MLSDKFYNHSDSQSINRKLFCAWGGARQISCIVVSGLLVPSFSWLYAQWMNTWISWVIMLECWTWWMESVTWLGEAFDMVEPVLSQIAEHGNMDMLNCYEEWKVENVLELQLNCSPALCIAILNITHLLMWLCFLSIIELIIIHEKKLKNNIIKGFFYVQLLLHHLASNFDQMLRNHVG